MRRPTLRRPINSRRRPLTGALVLLACLLARVAATAAAAQPAGFQRHAALFLMKCAKCHTIGGGQRVGPDLRGVTDRRETDWIVGFIMNPDGYLETDPAAKKLLADNNGVRMENTHLTREQALGLLEFLKAASQSPLASPRADVRSREEPLYQKVPMPNEGLSVSPPGLALLLLLLAAVAILFQSGQRRFAALGCVAALAVGYWTFGGRRFYHLLGNQQGYEPLQPIAFSHALHAGRLAVSCLYCHSGAERSDVAGVPALNVCMNCHAAVRARSGSKEPSPDIARLVAAWQDRAQPEAPPLEWVRVHHLPDFVHFSHRVHVADNLQCQECHGPVQTMERLRQAASLSMGWCIACHRLAEGAAPAHWKRIGGPLDCAACHW